MKKPPWKHSLLLSVSLLPLGVTIPKAGVMPLENMWRRVASLENCGSYIFPGDDIGYPMQSIMR
jgi:hypothetical protein